MQFAISFVVSLIIAICIVAFGWRKRPATRPATMTTFGKATLVLGAASLLTALPAITAAISIVLSGLGLMTGAFALIRRDTHRWTIVGQCLVLLPALFWIVFLVAELMYPH